jgi:hypothetical protein
MADLIAVAMIHHLGQQSEYSIHICANRRNICDLPHWPAAKNLRTAECSRGCDP